MHFYGNHVLADLQRHGQHGKLSHEPIAIDTENEARNAQSSALRSVWFCWLLLHWLVDVSGGK